MSEPSTSGLDGASLAPQSSEAQRILEEIQQIKAKAEELLKTVENARQKADSDALYASNAKGFCEKHSTEIANLKGTAESDAQTIISNKQKSDELIAALVTGKASIDADAKTINDRRKDADQSAQEIAKLTDAARTGVSNVDVSKTSAESAASAAQAALSAASEALKNTETTLKEAQGLAANAEAAKTKAETWSTESKKLTDEIQTMLQATREAEKNLTTVWERLKQSDEKAIEYEQGIAKQRAEFTELRQRIEGLLPGATSVGLASSFNKQKTRFTPPQKLWLITFVACIVLLVAVSIPSFYAALRNSSAGWTWNETWRSLTVRLPVVLPLVWLAIYAGRNYMSLRMDEDYAYKEAISTAFEGYKREMEKIAAYDSANPSPLAILCRNVLTAIAERPGRIYEGKHRDITLLTEAHEVIEKGAEFSKKKLAGPS
jgi:uncharacterized coiled-coil DUF342 family protein